MVLINCPVCHNPPKPIMVNGLQSMTYRGEKMWHCCGNVYPPFTLKEATMKPEKKRRKK